jgi:hypothetical protein
MGCSDATRARTCAGPMQQSWQKQIVTDSVAENAHYTLQRGVLLRSIDVDRDE